MDFIVLNQEKELKCGEFTASFYEPTFCYVVKSQGQQICQVFPNKIVFDNRENITIGFWEFNNLSLFITQCQRQLFNTK